jgi:hypothetical protein
MAGNYSRRTKIGRALTRPIYRQRPTPCRLIGSPSAAARTRDRLPPRPISSCRGSISLCFSVRVREHSIRQRRIGNVGHRTPCNFLIKSMAPQFDALIYAASIWVIPLIIAITFHEAAHGYVARFFGDNTAWQFGRVTLNPFKHIDLVGTILLPVPCYS